MTSRDRVLAAFAHEEPDRVPAWCGASEEFWAKAKRESDLDDEGLRVRLADDFRRVFARYAGPEIELSPGATSVTPFGVERQGLGCGRPTSHPLASVPTADRASHDSILEETPVENVLAMFDAIQEFGVYGER